MDEYEINGAALDKLIRRAVNGDPEALKSLMSQLWLYELINRIAELASRRYHVEQGRHKVGEDDEGGKDVYEVVFNAVRDKITSLKKSGKGRKRKKGKVSWRARLASWAYRIARNHCINVITRDWPKEEGYRKSVEHANTRDIRGGKRNFEPCSAEMSEEEAREREAEEERQDAARASRVSKIDEALSRIYDLLTPEEQLIVSLWAEKEMSYQQIAVEIGSSIETVRRKLIPIQMAFNESIGKLVEEFAKAADKKVSAERIIEELMEHRAKKMRELITSGMRATGRTLAARRRVRRARKRKHSARRLRAGGARG